MENGSFIQDDMLFKPYIYGGYQCIIELPIGIISVRMGGHGVITKKDKPYEVRYPDGEIACQDANDIFRYIGKLSKK